MSDLLTFGGSINNSDCRALRNESVYTCPSNSRRTTGDERDASRELQIHLVSILRAQPRAFSKASVGRSTM